MICLIASASLVLCHKMNLVLRPQEWLNLTSVLVPFTVKELLFISHTMSTKQKQWIFTEPQAKLSVSVDHNNSREEAGEIEAKVESGTFTKVFFSIWLWPSSVSLVSFTCKALKQKQV